MPQLPDVEVRGLEVIQYLDIEIIGSKFNKLIANLTKCVAIIESHIEH